MPNEIRQISFQPAEVARALLAYGQHMGKPLPPGSILACEPVGDGRTAPVVVQLSIRKDDAAKDAPPHVMTVEGAALAAALILYCRSKKIPLPAAAGKSIRTIANQVCLIVTVRSDLQGIAKPGRIRKELEASAQAGTTDLSG